ncbi:MAG: CaiB/BaiF CoA-transferase family protein [Acidobacteriota bacterium]
MPEPFLQGLRVVALEQAVAAPLCTRRLAEAGADVIKIERPEGDFARGYDTAVHGESAYFVWLNAGKRSVVLDLEEPADLQRLEALVKRADVVVQNLKPGALTKLGLDLVDARKARPELITCSISGYPSSGPSARKKAYDLLLQAETGLASITGTPDGPGRVGVSVCDIGCGMFAYEAVLGALIRRGLTGRGQAVEVSLFEAMAEWMTVPYLLERYGHGAPQRVGLAHPGIAPYGVFESGDGQSFVLAVQNEREWRSLCERVLQRPEWTQDERTATNAARVRHRELVDRAVQDAAAGRSYPSMEEKLVAADIAHAPVHDVGGLVRHRDLLLREIEVAGRSARLPAPPGAPSRSTTPRVPKLGEHTDEVFAEIDR